MPAKRVHWADEEEGPAFVPPSTPWTPPLMLTNTDDSLTESPPPATPRSASGGLQQQDLLTEYSDTTRACTTASPPNVQFIPSHEVPTPVAPTFDAGTQYQEPPANFNTNSLLPPHSLTRHSPQREQIALNLYLDHSAEAPSFIWDICEEPSESTVRLASDSVVPDALLKAAATVPPTQEMRIQCIWHAGWQPLTIRVSNSPTGASPHSPQYITIFMVIKEMYKYLYRRVTGAEYARFGAIPGEQDTVSRAFYARCERHLQQNSPHSRTAKERAERETQGGLRRVDCLRGHTLFLGLTSSEDEEGLWHVHCGPATWWPEVNKQDV